jgi:hypothetical protein
VNPGLLYVDGKIIFYPITDAPCNIEQARIDELLIVTAQLS